MSFLSTRMVARREIKDQLSDWRMLFPITILTFIVPLVIWSAARYMVRFTGDAGSTARIIPFGLLLSGFLPASFSLITALESFVGEKERNTLESLLAMPMNDRQLYIGKLIAATLPPLSSALLAMATYALAFNAFADVQLYTAVNKNIMWLMVALIAVKAIAMVAGAVIISSHTTTIRAANLLASFVLIPVSVVVQLEALVIIAQLSHLLWNIFWALLAIALILVRTGMNSFNREEILSREHAGFNTKRIGWTFRRFWSAYKPAGVAPEAYTEHFSLRRFYRHELSALLHDYRGPLLVACVATLTGLLFGYFASGVYSAPWLETAIQRSFTTQPAPSLQRAIVVAGQNVRANVFADMFALFSFGITAFLVPAAAFAQIGYVAAWAAAHGTSPWTYLLAYVLPHGLIELPAVILSAALGIRIGASLLFAPKGFSVGQNILWSFANFAKVFVFVIVPATLVAALIEGLITPLVIRAVAAG